MSNISQFFGNNLVTSAIGINTVGNIEANEGTFGTSAGTGPSGDNKFQVTGSSYFDGNVGIKTESARAELDVIGDTKISGSLEVGTAKSVYVDGRVGIGTTVKEDIALDIVGNANVVGVVTATSFVGDGSALTNLPGGGSFNVGISSLVYAPIGASLGVGHSFENTATKSFIVESIHVSNKGLSNTYVTATQRFLSNTTEVPFANKIIVPYQGAVELLEEPFVANDGDILKFQAFSGIGTDAGGISGALDAFITYSEQETTSLIGTGTTITNTVGGVGYAQTVYTSSSYPTVIQSIRLVNTSDTSDVDASVSIYKNGTIRMGYLVYNLTVPQNSTVEICSKPKYLNTNDTLVVDASNDNVLATFVSGKTVVPA